MNTPQVQYAVVGDRGILKLGGAIRHPLSQRLSRAARLLFFGTGIRSVIVDLQEANFIDSTCLGLLARVGLHCLELGFDPPIIVSTQKDVTRLLRTTGFDRAFILVENPSQYAAAFANAGDLPGDPPRLDPQLVLDAHRALCEMNENNAHLFRNVIEVLESDLVGEDWIDPALHSPGASGSFRHEAR